MRIFNLNQKGLLHIEFTRGRLTSHARWGLIDILVTMHLIPLPIASSLRVSCVYHNISERLIPEIQSPLASHLLSFHDSDTLITTDTVLFSECNLSILSPLPVLEQWRWIVRIL